MGSRSASVALLISLSAVLLMLRLPFFAFLMLTLPDCNLSVKRYPKSNMHRKRRFRKVDETFDVASRAVVRSFEGQAF